MNASHVSPLLIPFVQSVHRAHRGVARLFWRNPIGVAFRVFALQVEMQLLIELPLNPAATQNSATGRPSLRWRKTFLDSSLRDGSRSILHGNGRLWDWPVPILGILIAWLRLHDLCAEWWSRRSRLVFNVSNLPACRAEFALF
jgi:hypothetical protein